VRLHVVHRQRALRREGRLFGDQTPLRVGDLGLRTAGRNSSNESENENEKVARNAVENTGSCVCGVKILDQNVSSLFSVGNMNDD
jgi:hypothetical protein